MAPIGVFEGGRQAPWPPLPRPMVRRDLSKSLAKSCKLRYCFSCDVCDYVSTSLHDDVVSSAPMHNVQHPQQKRIQRSSTSSSNRSMSMEDYDKPLRSRTMSVESATGAASTTPPARTVSSPAENQ